MTDEMLELARKNAAEAGADNVEFLKGYIEEIPLPDGTVDVIISNCVINLSPDKAQVFREVYRVLKPGGRLAVSDIVTDGPLPDAVKQDLAAWAGCVAGALDVTDYVAAIEAAGFSDVTLTRSYWDQQMIDEAVAELSPEVVGQIRLAEERGIEPRTAVFSAKVTARKRG